jgi:DNA polymerase IV
MVRIIMCVDMDAFFASVEQRENPALRGKPIAVTGAGERTVVTTASYEARVYGVKTGITIYEAKRLCPQIILVTGHNKLYAETCASLEQICLRFSPDLEIYSIDEVFLDITGSHALFGGPEAMARTLKAAIKNELAITCTIGIGPNVLVAKLASDMAKPDGLLWITEEKVDSVFEHLPVKKLWGIGLHTEERLRALHITTCGQLARAPLPILTRKFGILGERLREMGAGKLERPLEIDAREPKSIGHSITLPKDIWKRDDLVSCLLRLSERVTRRARRFQYQGRRVTITVRYNDFATFTKQTTLPEATNDTHSVFRSLVAILDGIELKKSVRLLGVSLSELSKEGGQMSLFEEKDRAKRSLVNKAVDAVNDKFGEHTVTFALTVDQDSDHKVISPAWRPSGIRKSEV